MTADPLARGDISPRRMLEILKECGMEDEAERFVLWVGHGKKPGAFVEALYFRDDCHECESEDCTYVTPYDDDLERGLCEKCREAAQDAKDQAMYRGWKL